MSNMNWKLDNAFSRARTEGTALFATVPELDLQLSTSVLRGVLRFLQRLSTPPINFHISHDWRDHDGLEFHKGEKPISYLFEISKSSKELFEQTPKDDYVYLRALCSLPCIDLRIRTAWNEDETGMIGDIQLSLPEKIGHHFALEFSDKNMWPIFSIDSQGAPCVLLHDEE